MQFTKVHYKDSSIICTLPSVFSTHGLILIPLEQPLYLLVPQHQRVLLEIIINSILRYLILVIIIVLLDTRGNVRRFYLPPLQPSEIDVLHPVVTLKLFYTTVTEPTLGVALEELSDGGGTWLIKSRASRDHRFGSS